MSFWNTNAFALAVIGAVIGLLLIGILDDKEKENVLGNFLVGVGCVLLIAASQQEALDKRNEPDTTEEINQLKKKIAELEEKINLLIG
jgi:uncharacterized membrane protein YfcA